MAFRREQWVTHEKHGIGIIAEFGDDGTIEYHAVGENGETTARVKGVAPEDLRQARYDEIPESRRATGHPHAFYGRGYEGAPKPHDWPEDAAPPEFRPAEPAE